MKISLNNKDTFNKTLYYEESYWTGKKTIVYYGIPLKKLSFNKYLYEKGSLKETFEVNGNFLIGLTIKMFDREIKLIRKPTWYEILLSILVMASFFIFGTFGGVWCSAICGGLGGGIGMTNFYLIKRIDKIYLKLLLSVLLIILGLLLSYIFSFLIFKAPPIF